MSLTQLLALVSPPENPIDRCSADHIKQAESKLGVKLPTDYAEFMKHYGCGCFAGFYWVHNPITKNQYLSFERQVKNLCDAECQIKRNLGDEYVPYALFPDSPGLLPWGTDDNGNCYYWLTEGDPDSWPVVQNEVRGAGFTVYQGCTMSIFLTKVLTGEIEALASDYPTDEDFVFVPIQSE